MQCSFMRRGRIEPPTSPLSGQCSAAELTARGPSACAGRAARAARAASCCRSRYLRRNRGRPAAKTPGKRRFSSIPHEYGRRRATRVAAETWTSRLSKVGLSSREGLPAEGQGAISDCASDRSRAQYAPVARPCSFDSVSLIAAYKPSLRQKRRRSFDYSILDQDCNSKIQTWESFY